MLIRSITQNYRDNKIFEIITVPIVGTDTITKYVGTLKIFVI